ncbi:lysoplasmalogenase [Spiractinospora alimapuensis]|uniref:lysoplasmalogenase n=1 Tax=Spiractinospora alimapuensis TaxID=2820884 RepID=UPI001F3B0CFB|nr:lysoplasmalogenase [Spiractinospora alimapuensis]QVQ54325.1 lysoplasmalogenase [Spiractinospora alimapuensis]
MLARVVLVLFWVTVALDLVGLTVGSPEWHWVTKSLLMPLLACYVAASVGGRVTRGIPAVVMLALAASWLADIALLFPGTRAFLVGVSLFGVAQLAYTGVFLSLGALRRLRGRWPVPLVYAVVWAGAVTLLWPMMDDLISAVAVALYGALLAVMAATAAGVRFGVAVGALVFVVSDFMVGLSAGGVDGLGQLVMATYTVAQFLIVTGLLRERAQRGESVPSEPSPRPGTTSPAS